MKDIVGKIVRVHDAFGRADVPHAFGGALALAWCTRRARGTVDIDCNVFVPASDAQRVIRALPRAVEVTDANRADIDRDGQTRLWWGDTPLDLFFDTTEFHEAVARRARTETFAGREMPFVACRDLAVFKLMFNRSRDWTDIEEMLVAGTFDVATVIGEIVLLLGTDDERIGRLRALAQRVDAER